MSAQLGSFRLVAPIARGGMGEVWRGRHTSLGVHVAVKVLTDAAYRRSELGQALQSELRAVAQLDHPHIVRVHDAGTVPEDCADIPAGSPWLAMELLRGGSIAKQPRGDWKLLRRVLSELLGALAHAHARGVLHRDLKPGNVLVDDDGHTRLTDFGMVYALDARGAPIRGGTPAWCAPEQLRSAWLEQGPWTDLYGLGCLAWALLSGRRPWEPTTAEGLLHAQRQGPGDFAPRFSVPEGLEDWLRRALAPDPADRWARAADALHALHQLGDATTQPLQSGPEVDMAAPTLTASSAPTVRTPASGAGSGARTVGLGGPSPGLPVVPRAAAPPPLPAVWTVRRRPPDPAAFAVGLGLYRLRALPLIGRSDERGRLWDAVHRVHRDGRAGAVVLQGAAGVGKTHLATALAHHAHETGAAQVLRVTARAGRTLEELMLERHRAHGLTPDEVQRAVLATTAAEQLSDPWERQMLARLTAGEALDVPPATRWRLGLRMLDRLANPRLTLVVIDDAPRDADVLRFVAWALGEVAPVLFVLTARDEDIATTDDADELLSALYHAPAPALRLPVPPLDAHAHRTLLETLLPLDPDLVAQVAHRTAGNPLFAVQLVGDWVGRGLLRATRHGLELAEGASADLPDDVRQVWSARIAPLLDALPQWRAPLEVAAALGEPVQADEWAAACARLDLVAPPGLPARLAAEGLANLEQGALGSRWSFTHGMLREAVLADARAGGRDAAVHTAIARVLEDRGASPDRRAVHWLAAGQPDRAADALRPWALSRQPHDLAENARIGAIAIHAAEAAGADDVLGAALVHRAHALARLRSQPGSSLDMAARGLRVALRCEEWETALRAYAYLSWTHRIEGDHTEHVRLIEAGAALAEAHPELRGTGAWVSYMSSRVMEAGFRRALEEQLSLMDEILAEATEDFDKVRTLARKASTLSVHGRTTEAARVLAALDPLAASSGLDDELQLGVTVSLARGTVLREVGDLDGAVAAFATALKSAERKGSREDAWLVRHRWAEAVRAAGDWEAAARAHREMFAETALFGHLEGQVGAALCLALSLLDGGRGAEAQEVMDDLDVVLGADPHWADGLVQGIRAAAAALEGNRLACRGHLKACRRTLDKARESWFGVLRRAAESRGWSEVTAELADMIPDRASAR